MRLLLLITLLGLSLGLHAGRIDGNELFRTMEEAVDREDLGYQSGFFDGYVLGFADTTVNVLWCPPKSAQPSQISKVVANYLSQHPELLNDPAEVLVIDALSQHFPCQMPRILCGCE